MTFHWKNHCFLKTCPSWGTNDTRVVPLSAQATWDLCRAPAMPEDSWEGRLLAGYSPGEPLWMRGFYGLTIRELTCLERNISQSSRILAKFECKNEMPNIPRWQDTRPSYGLIDASVYGACPNLGSPKNTSATTGWGPPVISWFINHYNPH